MAFAGTHSYMYRSSSGSSSRSSTSRASSKRKDSVSRSPRPDVPCLGCDLYFNTYADMIYHLESMTCLSGIDATYLNSLAARCHYWKDFVNPDARMEMLHEGMDFPSCVTRPFECPCCSKDFSRLSRLFEHCERKGAERGGRHRSGSIKKLQAWLDDATKS